MKKKPSRNACVAVKRQADKNTQGRQGHIEFDALDATNSVSYIYITAVNTT
jgi:hypothetical protein